MKGGKMWSPEMKEWLLEQGFLPRTTEEAIQRHFERKMRKDKIHRDAIRFYADADKTDKPATEIEDYLSMTEYVNSETNKLRIELSLQNNILNEHIDKTTKRKELSTTQKSKGVAL